MKFLVDANLPYKLAKSLKESGFDVLHTDELPNKERTKDSEIRAIALAQSRIVISKDSDFLDSHIISGNPKKLLLVSTGNIVNKDLIELVRKNFERILNLFESYDLIELDNERIIGHEK